MTASTGATENDQSSIGDTSPVVIVTGMSGAGRSTALKALEDLGYEAVDNLPLSLLSSLLSPGNGGGRALAIGVDARTRDLAGSIHRTTGSVDREGGSARPIAVS